MKTVKTLDGKIQFVAYDINDLPEPSKFTAILDWINFEVETMEEDNPYYYLVLEMEEMQTPWFLAQAMYDKEKQSIIETLEANEYLYDVNGKMIPITHYTGKHPKAGTFEWTFHGTKEPVTIEEICPA